MTAKKSSISTPPLPAALAQPAVGALNSVGATDIDKLARHREIDIAGLHGMGPKALTLLKVALNQKGKSLSP